MVKREFPTKKDWFFPSVFLFVSCIYIPIGTLAYIKEGDLTTPIVLGAILLALGVLFLVILYKTKYIVSEKELLCSFLFFKKKIPIDSIRKIEKSNGVYAGWKMNTAWKCLVIHYNKYDELLISPNNQDAFIQFVEQLKEQKNQTSQS